MFNGAALMAITALAPGLAAAPPPPPDAPSVIVVDDDDASAVVLDLVVPAQVATGPLAIDAVRVDGAPIASLVSVEPASTSVAIVLDDRPSVPPATVESEQGAAVELARTLDAGTELAVFTPSGLRTVATTDAQAVIARIAGITAGSPDVVPFSDTLQEAVTELSSGERPDRHLVILAADADLGDESSAAELAAAVSGSGIRVHVIASTGPGPLTSLVAATGGRAPTSGFTAGMDDVTVAISQRYRIETALPPGTHELSIAPDPLATASFATAPAPAVQAPVEPVPTSVPPPSAAPELAAGPGPVATPAGVVPSTVPRSAPASSGTAVGATSAAAGRSMWPLALAGGVILLTVGAVARALRRRRAPRAVTASATAAPVLAERPGGGRPAVVPATPAVERAIAVAVASETVDRRDAAAAGAADAEPRPIEAQPRDETSVPAAPPAPSSAREDAASSRSTRAAVDVPTPAVDQETIPAAAATAPPRVPEGAGTPPGERGPVPSAPVSGRSVASTRAGEEDDAGRVEAPVEDRPGRAAAVGGARRTTTPRRRVPADETGADEWLRSGELRMSTVTGEVWRGRRRVLLDDNERAVLAVLLEKGRDGVRPGEIIAAAGVDDDDPHVVDAIVARIRRRTGAASHHGLHKAREIVYYFDADNP